MIPQDECPKPHRYRMGWGWAERRVCDEVIVAQVRASSVKIQEGGVHLDLTLVDTPGFGDVVDNSNWLVSHISSVWCTLITATCTLQLVPYHPTH